MHGRNATKMELKKRREPESNEERALAFLQWGLSSVRGALVGRRSTKHVCKGQLILMPLTTRHPTMAVSVPVRSPSGAAAGAAAGLLRQLACCCISGATVSTIHDKLARM